MFQNFNYITQALLCEEIEIINKGEFVYNDTVQIKLNGKWHCLPNIKKVNKQ